MKVLNKLWGFRSNKLWKKIIACLYYLSCLIIVFSSFSEVPQVEANMYDMVIYKASVILGNLAFLIPPLLISDFNIKGKIPFLKKKKWWSDVFGFISIFIIVMCFSSIISLFHSNDYQNLYEEFNKTNVIYQQQETDEVPEENKSSMTEEELEEDLENLTDKENENPNNEINNNSSDTDNKINEENNDSEDKNIGKEEVNNNIDIAENNLIKIHYIDVGQGDSIFIELPNNKTMLIDAGESSKGKIVSSYISNLGYYKIDYIVGTHPHTDHIGGLAHIINSFDIGNIYMPKAVSTSKTYENLLNTISQKGLKITTARAGVNIVSESNLNINIVAPNREYSDLNNSSAVVKITYGNRKFLFMGDAETKSENDIISDVSADVIKVGHHGSETSSGQSFVNKVNSKYAIIMVGTNNQYNHPYQIIINRWINSGAKVYRTDINGNIIVTSDGNILDINSSR